MNQDNCNTKDNSKASVSLPATTVKFPAGNYQLPDAAACLLLPAAVAVVWAEVAAVALAAAPHLKGIDEGAVFVAWAAAV
jgi:hypothetical protein